ncbi:hypothetical protein [Brachybacterium hainanense]|uniref:Uncharacterized protein n=1 Tax=Brachybacterium hainanense TaxID=1541174 RepID=A0ABV6RE06_9MICO
MIAAFSIGLLVCSCTSPPSPPDIPAEQPTSSAASDPEPDLEAWAQIEMTVLDAIDYDPRPKGAAYDAENDRVVVTLYTLGDEVTPAEIRDMETAGEAATDGVDVVVETTDADPPRYDEGKEDVDP